MYFHAIKPTLISLLLFITPAWAQQPQCSGMDDFLLAIDIGHSPTRYGATSARGRGEYAFNKELAEQLLQSVQEQGLQAFIITADDPEMVLEKRAQTANERKASLMLSIHHDSVQEHYLSEWTYEGKALRYSDKFSGYSIFISQRNSAYVYSRQAAGLLGIHLYNAGFTPTFHHAEPIPGENRPVLDDKYGIFQFDDLRILRNSTVPAVLLENGVIVNRDEEILLRNVVYQRALVNTITAAVNEFAELNCRTRILTQAE
jgi:N-acetylmuramoyl-L-alanine amidase